MTTKPTSPMPAGIVKTLSALAKACCVSDKTAQTWAKARGFPKRPEGYSVWEVAAWYHTLGPGAPVASDDSDFASGPASPALERWRTARADSAEMDLAERCKQLLSREDVHRFHVLVAGFLASHGEQLQRDGHIDAFNAWEDTLANLERITDAFFASQFEGSWTHQQGRYLVTIVDTPQADANSGLEETT